jgi:hypothetical protein
MITNKCVNCKKKYEPYMLSNYNLDLCRKCYDDLEINGEIVTDNADYVVHTVTCPLCKKKYDNKHLPIDSKCKTKDCKVWFFWDELDCVVVARYIAEE